MEIQPLNGATKRRLPSPPSPPYKECMKNHAAARGGHTLDGCCEFMPSLSSPLSCAACSCHRNFHRREPPPAPPHLTSFTPLHRHQPPIRSPSSRSPPPISSFYPSAPLFSLGGAGHSAPPFARKRIRTKFTQHQKERMLGFAEKIGWKMQRGIEDTVAEFCSEIGVERGVFKVWMHNHKNSNSNSKRDLNLDFDGHGSANGLGSATTAHKNNHNGSSSSS